MPLWTRKHVFMSQDTVYIRLSDGGCFVLQVDLEWIHLGGSQSFKTLFLGDSSVGKTCLAKLYVERQVLKSSTNTIGFDHLLKEVELKDGISVGVRFKVLCLISVLLSYETLGLFPGLLRLQFLITCSVQKQREKGLSDQILEGGKAC